jgi:hypothetical protein
VQVRDDDSDERCIAEGPVCRDSHPPLAEYRQVGLAHHGNVSDCIEYQGTIDASRSVAKSDRDRWTWSSSLCVADTITT